MEIYAKFIECVRTQQLLSMYTQIYAKEYNTMTFVYGNCLISNFLEQNSVKQDVRTKLVELMYTLKHPFNPRIEECYNKILIKKSGKTNEKLTEIVKSIMSDKKKLIPYNYFVSAFLKVLNDTETELYDLKIENEIKEKSKDITP